ADVIGAENRPERFKNVIVPKHVPADFVAKTWRPIDQPEIAAIDVFKQTLAPEFLHERNVVAQGREVGNDGLIGDDEVAAAHRAVNGRFDALFEVSNQVTHIAAENLIASLAAEHYFAISARQLRNHVLRE